MGSQFECLVHHGGQTLLFTLRIWGEGWFNKGQRYREGLVAYPRPRQGCLGYPETLQQVTGGLNRAGQQQVGDLSG